MYYTSKLFQYLTICQSVYIIFVRKLLLELCYRIDLNSYNFTTTTKKEIIKRNPDYKYWSDLDIVKNDKSNLS